MKIGVVGDLSGRDPARLEKALTAALAASDVVVQVGDLHPAYELCRGFLKSTNRLLMVPGNHDVDFDTIGVKRQWKVTLGEGLVTLIGIDNSSDQLDDTARALLAESGPSIFGFVFAHKAPKPVILPNGQISNHVMAEGAPSPAADDLCAFLKVRADAMVCGHYHDWSVMQGAWGTPLILEGRGGAADMIGWTAITVLPQGWSAQRVDIG
jgi:predicted phosphodiesterase